MSRISSIDGNSNSYARSVSLEMRFEFIPSACLLAYIQKCSELSTKGIYLIKSSREYPIVFFVSSFKRRIIESPEVMPSKQTMPARLRYTFLRAIKISFALNALAEVVNNSVP